jgi:uncharacterized membrane protein YdjX (TVP38/TMEM64 family)
VSTSTYPILEPVAARPLPLRAVAVGLAAASLVALAIAVRPSTRDLQTMAGWVRAHGVAGLAVLALGYVGMTLAALPVAALTMLVGYAYGVGVGLALAVPISLAAALASFAIGRTCLRRRLEQRLRRDRRFASIDRAIGESGFRITLLVRLSPIVPFAILNYALAATSVRARPYLAATALGLVPGTLVYLYLGTLLGTAGSGGTGQQALCAGGLVATILAVAAITRAARRALAHAGAADVAA